MARKTVESELHGAVWKIEVAVGDDVSEDDTLMIMESMKMEIPVDAPVSGKMVEICVGEGDVVTEGQPLAILET